MKIHAMKKDVYPPLYDEDTTIEKDLYLRYTMKIHAMKKDLYLPLFDEDTCHE